MSLTACRPADLQIACHRNCNLNGYSLELCDADRGTSQKKELWILGERWRSCEREKQTFFKTHAKCCSVGCCMWVCKHAFFISVHMNVSYRLLYLEKNISVKIISLSFSVNLNPISSGGTCSLLCYVQTRSSFLWVRNEEPRLRIWLLLWFCI